MKKNRTLIGWGIGTALVLAFHWLVLPSTDAEPMDWRRWQYRHRPELQDAVTEWLAARDSVRVRQAVWEVADSRARAPRTLPRGSTRDSNGLAVIAEPALPASVRAGAEASARAELQALNGGTSAYPVAVVVILDSLVQFGSTYRRAIVLPRAEGEPCTVVVRVSRRVQVWNRRPAGENVLGTCGFYAAYGAPGAGMDEWLRATGMRTATYARRPANWRVPEGKIAAPNARYWPGLASCRAGREASCAAMFDGLSDLGGSFDQARRLALRTDVTVQPPITGWSPVDGLSGGLLERLAAAMGRERFGTLWRDARAPAAAHESITGRPLSEWVGESVAEAMEPYRPGPAVPALPLTGTLVLAVGAGMWAVRGSRRRMS